MKLAVKLARVKLARVKLARVKLERVKSGGEELDSNQRRLSRQIYSLIPLAAREPLHTNYYYCIWPHFSKKESGGGSWIRTSEG